MPVRICFVCLGNICRSPTAAALLKHYASRAGLEDAITIESAGTGSWIAGGAPHPVSVRIAAEAGIEIRGDARRFDPADFDRFDHVVALDDSVHATLLGWVSSPDLRSRLELLRSFDPLAKRARDVPDPMGGSEREFRETFAVCERSCRGYFAALCRRYGWNDASE